MSCHVVSYRVMSCHVMPCHVMSCLLCCHVVSCHVALPPVMCRHVQIVSRCVLWCRVASGWSNRVASCCPTSRHAGVVSYQAIMTCRVASYRLASLLFGAVSCHIVSHRVVRISYEHTNQICAAHPHTAHPHKLGLRFLSPKTYIYK